MIADPSAFYYNVHNDPFQGGAIRGQLEFVSSVAEPGSAGLLILGLIGVAWLRRRSLSPSTPGRRGRAARRLSSGVPGATEALRPGSMPGMLRPAAAPPSSPPVAEQRPHVIASPHGSRTDEYYWLRDDTRSDPRGARLPRSRERLAGGGARAPAPLTERLYQEFLGRIRQEDASVPYRKRGHWYYSRFEAGDEYSGACAARGRARCAGTGPARSARTRPRTRVLRPRRIRRQPRRAPAGVDRGYGRTAGVHAAFPGPGHGSRARRHDHRCRIAGGLDRRSPRACSTSRRTPARCSGVRVRRHVLGTPQAEDELVYEEHDEAFYTWIDSSKDERFLLIGSTSTLSTELRFARADDPSLRFQVLLPRERDHEYEAEPFGERWIIRTNRGAPNFRLVEAGFDTVRERRRLARADRAPRGCEHRGLRRVRHVSRGRGALGRTASSAAPRLGRRARQVHRVRRARLPDGARAERGIGQPGRPVRLRLAHHAHFDLRLRSRHAAARRCSSASRCSAISIRPTTSPSTCVPRRATASRCRSRSSTGADWLRDGTAPLLQYGYGAYGLSSDPSFSSRRLSLLDRGFVYAIAQVRGGQELGRRWYDEGRSARKAQQLQRLHRRHALAGRGAATPIRARRGDRRQRRRSARWARSPTSRRSDYRAIVAHVPFVDVVTTMLDSGIPLTTNEYDEWGDPQRA